jgi:hypothetical protein
MRRSGYLDGAGGGGLEHHQPAQVGGGVLRVVVLLRHGGVALVHHLRLDVGVPELRHELHALPQQAAAALGAHQHAGLDARLDYARRQRLQLVQRQAHAGAPVWSMPHLEKPRTCVISFWFEFPHYVDPLGCDQRAWRPLHCLASFLAGSVHGSRAEHYRVYVRCRLTHPAALSGARCVRCRTLTHVTAGGRALNLRELGLPSVLEAARRSRCG